MLVYVTNRRPKNYFSDANTNSGIIGALFVPELLESSALDSLSAGLCRKCVRRSADVQTQTADEPRWRQARQNILVSLAFSPSLTFFLASNVLETKDRAVLTFQCGRSGIFYAHNKVLYFELCITIT